ncbi:MAG: YtxH domain-containing protein [Bryobacterales bacterium]|nr:YtxH domain-containing protein [Bryobacterales bacterium]
MAQESGDKVVWFLAGAAIGAAIALLYAPASGEETRAKLLDKANEGRDLLGERGRDLMERGRELYSKGKGMADEAADMLERGRKLVEG